MWVIIALVSALFLGLYDISKKESVKENAVLPVLWCHTLFCTLFMLPPVLLSNCGLISTESLIFAPKGDLNMHLQVLLKSSIVLGSWVFGYFGMKHLPITIAGPVNATRPVMILVGGLLLFGERLNFYQWTGVIIAIISFYLLGISGKKEGIDFKHNKWVCFVIAATFLGAVSGLYDKYLMGRFNNVFVQAWCNFYQLSLMTVCLFTIWFPTRKETTPFRWKWSIPLISVFLTLADWAYFYSLTSADSMITIVSMVRRCSVVVSFLFGALLFKEKNLKAKAFDLVLVLISLVFLLLGTLKG